MELAVEIDWVQIHKGPAGRGMPGFSGLRPCFRLGYDMDTERLCIFCKCYDCIVTGKIIASSGNGKFGFHAILFADAVTIGIFPSGIFQKLFRFLDTVILERIFAAPWSLRAGAECRCPAAA